MSNLSIRPGALFTAHLESVLRTAPIQKLDAPGSSTTHRARTVEDTRAFMAALEQMQSLAQLFVQFSAAFLAEMVMMYANQRSPAGPQTRAPSMRGRLPRGKFRSTRSTRAQSWKPKAPTRAPVQATPQQVAKIPNYNELAPELQKAALDAVSMGLRVTSTTGGRHAKTSNHYKHNQPDGKGHAIDVGGDPAKLAAFYRKYATTNPRELFYDPIGGIKRGRQIGPIGGHGNHVHLAV